MRQQISSLRTGESICFPIHKKETIRNYVTSLNANGFLTGETWSSVYSKEEGVIKVTKVS